MAVSRAQKEEVLKELVENFKGAKSVIFSANKGLSVTDFQGLRRELRDSDVKTKVAKKTLIRMAAKEAGVEIPEGELEGAVFVTFSPDEIAAAKILAKFAKDNEALELISGVLESEVLSKDEVIALSKIPSKEELIAKMIGTLQGPSYGMVGILNNVVSGLVRVMNAYKDTLPAEEVKAEEAAPAAEEKAEEVKAEEPKVEEVKEETKEEAAPAEEIKEEKEEAKEEEPPTEEKSE